jgi:hypothetical protein
MQSNGTGPTSRQLQDKVGGVTPAGLSLELLDIVRLVITSRDQVALLVSLSSKLDSCSHNFYEHPGQPRSVIRK